MTDEKIFRIADKYGEAFYLFDKQVFENNYKEFVDSFRKYYKRFNVAYSYKTNYIPPICKIVNEMNGYAEVVSEMELEIALRCGVPYQKIIWNGPIKNKEIVSDVISKGTIINIDSLGELEILINGSLNISKKYSIG